MRALALLLLPATLLAQSATPPDPEEAAYPAIERFVEVLEQVRQRHPDADKLAYDRLVNHALEGMLASLDPHSSFIHPEMAAMMKEQPDLDPHVPSLGLSLGWRDDGPYLANVLPGSPAAALLPGSAILKLDDHDVAKLPPTDLLSRLMRRPGETNTFTLKSPAEARPIEVTLIHRAIESRAVTHSHLTEGSDPTAGYIRLASFTDAAPREIEAALDELEDSGMRHLILDLRGNPGGSLPATVKILGYFLPPSTEVVTTRGRGGEAQGEPLKPPIANAANATTRSPSSSTACLPPPPSSPPEPCKTSIAPPSSAKPPMAKAPSRISSRWAAAPPYVSPSPPTTPPAATPPTSKASPPTSRLSSPKNFREKFALSLRKDALTPEEAATLESWVDPAIKAALSP